MSQSDPPVRSHLSAVMVLPCALLGGGLLWMVWLLQTERAQSAVLHAELANLRLAGRVAASRESLITDALHRAARLEHTLEQTLEQTRRAAPAPDAPEVARAAELERVIAFLRGEISAAHETIERLKQEGPGPRGKEG